MWKTYSKKNNRDGESVLGGQKNGIKGKPQRKPYL